MVKAIDVAKYIMELEEEKPSSTLYPLKLQKLCYHIQSFHLALWGKSLFDDDFQAWENGPCIYVLWKYYNPLRDDNNLCAIDLKEMPGNLSNISSSGEDFILSVSEHFRCQSGYHLSARTYREAPWVETKANGIIEKERMKNYYEKNKEAMVDLVGCLCNTKDESNQKAIISKLQDFITSGMSELMDVYNAIVDK